MKRLLPLFLVGMMLIPQDASAFKLFGRDKQQNPNGISGASGPMVKKYEQKVGFHNMDYYHNATQKGLNPFTGQKITRRQKIKNFVKGLM